MQNTKQFRQRPYKQKKQRFQKSVNSKVAQTIAKKEAVKAIRSTMELNYYDDLTNGTFSQDGTILDLTIPIAVGDTEKSRDGREIDLKSILIRFDCIHDDSTNVVRMILFRWMAPGDPTAAQVISSNNSIYAPISPLNEENTKHIQVLYDDLFATTTNSDAATVGKIYKKLKGKAVWASSAGAGSKGHLYLLVVSDSALSGPSMRIYSRVRYYE